MDNRFMGIESYHADNEHDKRKEELAEMYNEHTFIDNVTDRLIDDLDDCLDPIEDDSSYRPEQP
jgi:hypothetical protein